MPGHATREGGGSGRAAGLACLLLLAVAAWAAPAAEAADSIYWADYGTDLIRTGNLDGAGPASTPFTEPVGSGPNGVAIDTAANRIYWVNFSTNLIRGGNLDGTGAATLFSEPITSVPSAVAIDPVASRIYWANAVSSQIRAGNLTGSGAASTLFTEVGGSSPFAVAVNPAANKIYWANAVADTIRVGNLDGSGATTLFAGEDLAEGVALDPAANRIYWTAGDLVRVGNLDGTGASTLFNEPGARPYGVAIDPTANKIYWANFNTNTIRVGNLDGTGAPSTLFTEPAGSLPNFVALLRSPVAAGPPVAYRVTANMLARKGKRKRFKPGQLACTRGTWAPDLVGAFLYRTPRSFAYQWQLGGAAIPGATSSTFTPTKRGRYSCRVTASNHAGSASQTSALKCAKRKKPEGPGSPRGGKPQKKKKCRLKPKK